MNNTETFIAKFYRSIDIIDPLLLSKKLIIDHLNIRLYYWNHSSAIVRRNGKYHLFINESLTTRQQWQDFGHEMYHYFFDETRYDLLYESFGDYGETKADYFSYHFCVPTFMLMQLKEVSVDVITRLFNVEYEFALRRLEMYQGKLMSIIG